MTFAFATSNVVFVRERNNIIGPQQMHVCPVSQLSPQQKKNQIVNATPTEGSTHSSPHSLRHTLQAATLAAVIAITGVSMLPSSSLYVLLFSISTFKCLLFGNNAHHSFLITALQKHGADFTSFCTSYVVRI